MGEDGEITPEAAPAAPEPLPAEAVVAPTIEVSPITEPVAPCAHPHSGRGRRPRPALGRDPAGDRSRADPRADARHRGGVRGAARSGGRAGLLFDHDRSDPQDRAIQVRELDEAAPLWIIGDLHGDLVALESALALIARDAAVAGAEPRIVFLGDLFDDEGFGLELLLRVFELMLAAPGRVGTVAGNHDEALSYDGVRFATSVSPGDFADFLNANLAHEWIERTGKLAVRLAAWAPRALFLPDGLLVAHAGFPLSDLHARLEESGDWNEATGLSDFAWARAHPTARKKMPNRFTRGSSFGREDFAAFCALATRMGRPVTHMVRGHDHVDDRYVHLPGVSRESGADHGRAVTAAAARVLRARRCGCRRWRATFPGSLPQVHRCTCRRTSSRRRFRTRSDAAEEVVAAAACEVRGERVVLRCPNCGTRADGGGECDACHEAAVRYFCTNHDPGSGWRAAPARAAGARFGEAAPAPKPAPAPPRPAARPAAPRAEPEFRPTPSRPRPTRDPWGPGGATPPRADMPSSVDAEAAARKWLEMLEGLSRRPSGRDRGGGFERVPAPRPRGGCIGRLLVLLLTLLALAIIVPVLVGGALLQIF
jgi:hypothetical protein